AEQVGARRRPLGDLLAVAELVDGDCRMMAVRHGPDDVLRAPGRIAAEEYAGPGRHHGNLVDLRHAPFVELEADVALDPGEAVFLANRHQHVVAFEHDLFTGRLQLGSAVPIDADLLHLLEAHAGEPALREQELLWRVIVQDRNALVLGILDLPRRGLHHAPRRAHRNFDVHAAEPETRAATVHGGVAAANDDDALADRVHVLEGDGGEPVDADLDVGRRFLAAGNVEVLALGGAGADEDGIEAFLEQLLEALDLVTEARFDAEVEDALDLLVEHANRQAEGGDVGAHQPAALGVLLE